MKAVILAGGKATRLLPLTKDTPQSLLKVGDKAILERQLTGLNKNGVKDILVVTGHLADKIGDFLKGNDAKTFFNPFYSISGMLMSLWVVKEKLKDGFILLYSDILFEESIIKNLLNDKNDICLATKKDGIREEAEKVWLHNGIITKIGKTEIKEKADAEFIGIAKFSRKGAEIFINEMNEIANKELNAHFIDSIQHIVDKGIKVYGCDIGKAKWIDIDFEKDLKMAEEFFSK